MSGSASASKYTPIVTSKGRSLLGIAMEKENLQIIRYLTLQKGSVLSGEMDITPALLARNLEKVLRLLPEDAFLGAADATDSGLGQSNRAGASEVVTSQVPAMGGDFDDVVPLTPSQHGFHEEGNERTLSDEARDFGALNLHDGRQTNSNEPVDEECK